MPAIPFEWVLLAGAVSLVAAVTVLAVQRRSWAKKYTDFVSIIAHQMHGPLGGMRGATDMLINGDYGALPEPAQKIISQMKTSADRLLSLSETALNAARIEARAFQTAKVPTDVPAEIAGLIAELGPVALAKGIELTSSFSGLPPQLMLDRDILRNVVFNVIDNAITYTDLGRVSVTGSFQAGRLVVSVADTGKGLSAETMTALFRKFHHGKRRSGQDGSGLGLYVAQHLAGLAGGTIRAESAGLGKGSVFTIELPAVPPS